MGIFDPDKVKIGSGAFSEERPRLPSDIFSVDLPSTRTRTSTARGIATPEFRGRLAGAFEERVGMSFPARTREAIGRELTPPDFTHRGDLGLEDVPGAVKGLGEFAGSFLSLPTPEQQKTREIFKESFNNFLTTLKGAEQVVVGRLLERGRLNKDAKNEVERFLDRVGRGLQESGRENIRLGSVPIKIDNPQKFSEAIKDRQFIARGLGQTVPTLLGALGFGAAGTVVGGPVGGVVATFVFVATLEGGLAWQRAKEFGLSDRKADNAAIIVCILNGLLDTLPVTRALNRFRAGQIIRGRILARVTGDVLKQGGLEAGTESIQEIVSNAVARSYDDNQDILEGVKESAYFGGILGLATGGFANVRGVRGLQIEDVPLAEEARNLGITEEEIQQEIEKTRKIVEEFKQDPSVEMPSSASTVESITREALNNLISERKTNNKIEDKQREFGIERQESINNSDNFEDVFNESEVEEIVFHGTDAESIVNFERREPSGKFRGRGVDLEGEAGFWFTSNKDEASQLGNVVNAKLNMKDPLILEDDVFFLTEGTERLSAINEMEQGGHDGIIFIEPNTGQRWYFVPNPQQITTDSLFNQVKGVTEQEIEGGATPRELGVEGRATRQADFVRKRETTLLKDKIKNIDRGARIGERFGREKIAERLNEINTLIRESDLRPENKSELAITPKRIAEIKSPEAFEKVRNDKIAQIERLEAAQRFRDARARINKAIKSTKVKNRVSKFPAEQQDTMQRMFDRFREITKLNQDQSRERFENLQSDLRGKVPTLSQKLETTLLAIKSGSDHVTEQDAEQLAGDLEALIEEGRLIKDLRSFEEWQAVQNDIEDVLEPLEVPEGVETFGADQKTILENVKARLKILGVKSLSDWRGIISDLEWATPVDQKKLINTLGNVTPNNSKYAELYGDYVRDLNRAVRESYKARYDEKFKRLPDKIKNSAEFSPWTEGFVSRQIITDLINEEVNLGFLTNKDGITREFKMKRGELIKRWIELQDLTLTESFIHGNRYTQEIIEAIEENMTEEDKAFAREAMRMWQELYDRINPIYRAIYGINLPRNPFYSPIRREGFEVDIEEQFGEFLGEQVYRSAVTSGSFNERVANLLPIKTQDVFQSLDKHFGEMNYFIAWAQRVRQFHQIFNDKTVRDAIVQTFGKNAGGKLLERIDFQIRQFANKGHRNATSFERMLGKVRRAFIIGKIFFKPSIMVKQLVSRINFLEVLGPKELATGEAEFWASPIEKSKIIRDESPLLRERGRFYERDINDVLKSDEYARYTKSKSFLELGSLYVRIGDADATIFPGTWAYRNKLMKERGLDPSERAPQEVIDIYEDFADNNQQSANISTFSEWQQSGELARMFTVFRTQQHQNARKVVNAVKSLFQKGGRSKKNLKKVARTIVIYHSIQNMIFQLVATGLIQLIGDEDEEFVKDMAWAGVLGSLNFFPIGYDLVDSILRAAMGSDVFNQGSQDTPISEITKDIYNLVREVDPTQIDDFEVMEFLDDFARVGSDFSLPSEQALNLGRGVYSITKGNFLRGSLEAAQWSQWALEPIDETEASPGAIPEIQIPEVEIPEVQIPEVQVPSI